MIFVLVGIGVGAWAGTDSALSDGIGWGIFAAIFCLAVGVGLGYLVGAFVDEDARALRVVNEIKLIALNDNIGGLGRFFLGCGTIKEQLNYFYYQQQKDGEIVPGQIPANSGKLFEEERDDAVFRQVTVEQSGLFYLKSRSWQEIRVPNGTVKRDFTLNLA